MPLINELRTLIVSADVTSLKELRALTLGTNISGVGGYKLGFTLGLKGLQQAVESIRRHNEGKTIIIYDHQKGGNDIPAMGEKFAKQVKAAGCDAAILYPFAGPETQSCWTRACQDAGLVPLVGAVMTHQRFLVSEGGYISDDAPHRIFDLAFRDGVQDFVVPGTRPEWIQKLRTHLENCMEPGTFALYAPGFGAQDGEIEVCCKAAGQRFHPIVGRGIYDGFLDAEELMRAEAENIVGKLQSA